MGLGLAFAPGFFGEAEPPNRTIKRAEEQNSLNAFNFVRIVV
jgi:hypothetical protein